MKKLGFLMCSLVLVGALATGASALTIGPGDFLTGTNVINLTGATLTSVPRNFVTQTIGGVEGLGVGGGNWTGELDGAGESILITFSTPQIVSEITLAFLYPMEDDSTGPIYGDTVNEKSFIAINGGVANTLEATGATTATWTGLGSVTNFAQAVNGQGGAWTITNPFGNAAVTSILLTAPNDVPGSSAGSDYSLHSVTTSAVPIPAAAWLMVSGLVGLVGFRKKLRR